MKATNTFLNVTMALLTTVFAANLMAQNNFIAEFDDGDLNIMGQNNTEQGIGIEATGVPGELRIIALTPDTTVNGLLFVEFSGVTGDVTIDLRSGRKLLVMTEGASPTLFIGGDLLIKNRGNFGAVMLLDEVEVAGRFDIKTKNGDDALIMNGVIADGRTRINTGNGNDVAQIAFDSEFADELDVKTGGGADYVMSFLTTVFDETDIRTGGQNDTIGLYNSMFADVSVNGNGGNDALEIFDVDSLDLDERSIEDEFDGGLTAMFAEARAFNQNFDDAVVLFGFFSLGD